MTGDARRLAHPAVSGLVGVIVAAAAMVVPIWVGWLVAEAYLLSVPTTDTWLLAYLFGAVGGLAGVAVARPVLSRVHLDTGGTDT